MKYHSMMDLLNASDNESKAIWEIMLEEDCIERLVDKAECFEKMRAMYKSMKDADATYDNKLKSASGMAGGDGEKMRQYNIQKNNLCSEYTSLVMEKALKISESNACMKRIVAAPTAGSCGVIPAILLSYEECFHESEDKMVKTLFLCAGIGMIIAENASIAGASGGCQAEIGTAAAMASGGLVYLMGGTNEQISTAVAFTIKSMLGLVCDPVCGLVEVPCIKRNVSGAMLAISASQLALAGIESAIPTDEVIDAMRRVGEQIPECLRETARGGLATTETATKLSEQLKS